MHEKQIRGTPMAAINDLISQIEDKELRERIEQELNKISKQKKFGLVFEEHLPECVPLYDMPIKRGCKVAQKTGKINDFYTVLRIEGENVYCTDKKETQLLNFLKKGLVPIAGFGEPFYPYLKQVDSIYKSVLGKMELLKKKLKTRVCLLAS